MLYLKFKFIDKVGKSVFPVTYFYILLEMIRDKLSRIQLTVFCIHDEIFKKLQAQFKDQAFSYYKSAF